MPAVIGQSSDGKRPPERFILVPGRSHRLGDGTRLRLLDLYQGGAEVVLRARDAPGNPWALVAALTLVVGMGLMGRRWL